MQFSAGEARMVPINYTILNHWFVEDTQNQREDVQALQMRNNYKTTFMHLLSYFLNMLNIKVLTFIFSSQNILIWFITWRILLPQWYVWHASAAGC